MQAAGESAGRFSPAQFVRSAHFSVRFPPIRNRAAGISGTSGGSGSGVTPTGGLSAVEDEIERGFEVMAYLYLCVPFRL